MSRDEINAVLKAVTDNSISLEDFKQMVDIMKKPDFAVMEELISESKEQLTNGWDMP